jgi:caa(3)-type oxidase subunit IV
MASEAEATKQPATGAKKAGESHGDAAAHRAKYLKVFFALIVLTGLELGVVYAGLSKTTVIVALIGLAITKAGAVAMYFMHLADERRTLRLMVGLPLLFPPFYALVLIAEAAFRSSFMR